MPHAAQLDLEGSWSCLKQKLVARYSCSFVVHSTAHSLQLVVVVCAPMRACTRGCTCVVCCCLQGMGPAFTADIVQQLGVTATAALVGRFEGRLTGDLVQHCGPGGC